MVEDNDLVRNLAKRQQGGLQASLDLSGAVPQPQAWLPTQQPMDSLLSAPNDNLVHQGIISEIKQRVLTPELLLSLQQQQQRHPAMGMLWNQLPQNQVLPAPLQVSGIPDSMDRYRRIGVNPIPTSTANSDGPQLAPTLSGFNPVSGHSASPGSLHDAVQHYLASQQQQQLNLLQQPLQGYQPQALIAPLEPATFDNGNDTSSSEDKPIPGLKYKREESSSDGSSPDNGSAKTNWTAGNLR